MGSRKVTVKSGAAERTAAIAWYIESFGLTDTAERFAEHAYDFFLKMADTRKSHPFCKEPVCASTGS